VELGALRHRVDQGLAPPSDRGNPSGGASKREDRPAPVASRRSFASSRATPMAAASAVLDGSGDSKRLGVHDRGRGGPTLERSAAGAAGGAAEVGGSVPAHDGARRVSVERNREGPTVRALGPHSLGGLCPGRRGARRVRPLAPRAARPETSLRSSAMAAATASWSPGVTKERRPPPTSRSAGIPRPRRERACHRFDEGSRSPRGQA